MAEDARIARYSCVMTPYQCRAMVWLAHGETRSQPAGHPGRAARGRQRRARSPAFAAEPLGDEPGVGATAGDDGRSAAGPGRTRARPHAPGDRAARASRPARAGRSGHPAPGREARPRAPGQDVHAADQRRLRGELRSGSRRARSPRRRPACGCASCRRPTGTARRFATGSSIWRRAWWGRRRRRSCVRRRCSATASSASCAWGIRSAEGEITPARYAAGRHIVVSRRGLDRGPIDEALQSVGPGAGDRHHRRRLCDRTGARPGLRPDRQRSRTTHRKPARRDAQFCPAGRRAGDHGRHALAPEDGCRSGPSLAARASQGRLRGALALNLLDPMQIPSRSPRAGAPPGWNGEPPTA